MSDTKITQADIDAILKLLASTENLSDFHLKYGDLELRVSREPAGPAQPPEGAAAQPPVPAPAVPSVQRSAQADAAQPPAPKGPRAAAVPEGMAVVKAPMVGTFYRAPSPGATPFVEVGARVEEDSVVCIIEVMKLMNTIHAGAAGIVREIRVEDSQPVEFGQVLLVIEPDP